MNKIKRDARKLRNPQSNSHEALKRSNAFEKKKGYKPKSFSIFKTVAVSVILLILITFILILNLYEVPRESKAALQTQSSTPVLFDLDTVAEITVFTSSESHMEVVTILSDAMDRGNDEYTAYPLLIEPIVSKGGGISRGDVVMYEYDFVNGNRKTISRVVGLPGESVGISDGQIFVNGKKLKAFYGKAHRAGTSNPEEYRIWFEENTTSNSSTSGMQEIFGIDLKETVLLDNEVFLVGDDWFRGSQHKVELQAIDGEVLGYYLE